MENIRLLVRTLLMGPTIEPRKDLDGMPLLPLSSLVGKTNALSSKFYLTKVPRRSPPTFASAWGSQENRGG